MTLLLVKSVIADKYGLSIFVSTMRKIQRSQINKNQIKDIQLSVNS